VQLSVRLTNPALARTSSGVALAMGTGTVPGTKYSELKPCITINLLDFKCFPEQSFHTVFRLMEQQSGRVLDDVLELHFLEMPKIPVPIPSLAENHVMRDDNDVKEQTQYDDNLAGHPCETGNRQLAPVSLVEWLQFIRAESREELKTMADNNSTLAYAYNELDRASMDEMTRLRYEAREKALMDERSRVSEGYDEGFQLGVQQGKQQGLEQGLERGLEQGLEQGVLLGMQRAKNEIAKQLVSNGVTLHDEAALLGLSEEELGSGSVIE